MSNLPVVTTHEDVNMMRKLMNAVDNLPQINKVENPQSRIHEGYASGGHAGQRRTLNESANTNTNYYKNDPNIPVSPIGGSMASSRDISSMKDLLSKLESVAGDSVQSLVESTNNHYPEMTKQIMHYASDNSSKAIGSFIVKPRIIETNNGSRKVFDLYDRDGDMLMESISVSSAAQGIAKYLNKGMLMEDRKIQEIIDLEETYTRNRNDAARFRSRYVTESQKNMTASAEIFEHRYQSARAHALAAKDQLDSIFESIR